VALAIDCDLIKTKASAIKSIIPIHPKLDQQKASPVLMSKKVTPRQGGTYDWLEGRHVCPASRRMRRQKSEGLPVSSTFVMVKEFCRFVVGIVLEVFQRIGEDKTSRVCEGCASANLAEAGAALGPTALTISKIRK
jgi:hypothetical protein